MNDLKASLEELPWQRREHIRKLIDWLLSEVGSAGGDGDATWVVKNVDIFQLRRFVQDECLSNKDQRYWAVGEVEHNANGRRFSLSNNQESLVITTSEEDVPSWSQCTVIA